jgi:hypothetical protein
MTHKDENPTPTRTSLASILATDTDASHQVATLSNRLQAFANAAPTNQKTVRESDMISGLRCPDATTRRASCFSAGKAISSLLVDADEKVFKNLVKIGTNFDKPALKLESALQAWENSIPGGGRAFSPSSVLRPVIENDDCAKSLMDISSKDIETILSKLQGILPFVKEMEAVSA